MCDFNPRKSRVKVTTAIYHGNLPQYFYNTGPWSNICRWDKDPSPEGSCYAWVGFSLIPKYKTWLIGFARSKHSYLAFFRYKKRFVTVTAIVTVIKLFLRPCQRGQKARVFASGTLFQSVLIFACNARCLPLRKGSISCHIPASVLLDNIGIDWKGWPWTDSSHGALIEYSTIDLLILFKNNF